MKYKIVDFIKNIFGICIMYSVLIGAVVAIIYILGFILGGSMGENLAITGAKIMYSAITVAAIGSALGAIGFYLEGEHELTVNENDK